MQGRLKEVAGRDPGWPLTILLSAPTDMGLNGLESQQTLKLTEGLVDSRYPESNMPPGESHRTLVPRLPGPCPLPRSSAQGAALLFPRARWSERSTRSGVRRPAFEVSSAIRCGALGKSLFFWPLFSHAERDLFVDSLIQSLASYQTFSDTGPGPVAESTGGNPSSPSSLAAESLWNLVEQ